MVLIMMPGIAFLYSGLARRKSALSMIWVVMMSFSVIVFQWYFWGYSLAFSSVATNGFIGDLHHFGLMNTLAVPSPGSPLIPELLYSFYQMQFCAVTGALVVGATAERGRVLPAMVFTFFWATLVYCPIACWVWNINGWAFNYGVLDYAGGGPVEIGSGMSALAYSWILGRRNEKMMLNFRPHNISLILLGTILLWFGWLGFNGGSAFGANLRATMACWNSCLTAMFAAMTWCLLDFRLAKKWSLVGWCSGTISGLVAATPASGFIPPWASIVLGVVTGVCCNFGTKIKFLVGIDDSLDVFAEHGIGGIVGLIFNALFGAGYIIGLDGVNTGVITGGWLDHNYKQLYIQIAYICACSGYAFVVSAIIAKIIDLIPGLKLRASEEAELLGMDDDQHGEFGMCPFLSEVSLTIIFLLFFVLTRPCQQPTTTSRSAETSWPGLPPNRSNESMASAWSPSTASRNTRCWRTATPPGAAKRRRSGRSDHPTGPTTTGPATSGHNENHLACFYFFLSGFNNT